MNSFQTQRLFELLFVGPLMMLGGTSLAKRQPMLGTLLGLTGVGLTVYSGASYLAARGGVIPGGYAQGRRPEEFDQAQLAAGIKVEMEHTTDLGIAREIAMDHLVEDPQYYVKLTKAGL